MWALAGIGRGIHCLPESVEYSFFPRNTLFWGWQKKFKKIENAALKNFNEDEKQKFNDLLMRVYENMLEYDKEEKQQ